MPNLKIYVDETLYGTLAPLIRGQLADLRDDLCRELAVSPSACQLAVLSVMGLDGQPHMNVELSVMPTAQRTREKLTALAGLIQTRFTTLGVTWVAVRISTLDASTYVALK